MSSSSQLTVFAVDDEQDNIDLLVRALNSVYTVKSFTDPQEALAAAVSQRPVGLAIDYRMPALNGVDLVKELRRKGLTAAVLMVTAFPDVDEILFAHKTKLLYRIVPKPWQADELLRQMDMAIAEELYRRAILHHRLGTPD
ncbi:response regulator [Myxococcota bacterium]